MTYYLISFNQQWVGEHTEEWFRSRGVLARAVVAEMQAAGVVVFAGGLVEDLDAAFRVALNDDGVEFRSNPYLADEQFIGGMTIVDVPDLETAKMWAGKVAVACGWTQEVRAFGDQSTAS